MNMFVLAVTGNALLHQPRVSGVWEAPN